MSIWNEKAGLSDNIIALNREIERLAGGLERNNDLLHEHMRRTELLEKQMDTALLPIRAAKVFGLLLGVIATILSAWAAWTKIG